MEGSASIQLTQQAAKDLGLKDGQIVQGVLAARGDLLKLVLNNKELEWSGSNRFKPGDKLDFRVETNLFGRALIPLARAARSLASVPTSPRLLSLMHRPAQPSVLAGLLRPGALEALTAQFGGAEQLRANLMPSMSKLSPLMVKRGLINSGLFGEQNLAAGAPNTGLDLKQLLRSLLRSMQ